MGMKKSYKKIAMASAVALVASVAVNVQAGTFTNTGTAGTNIATEIFGSGSSVTPLPATATATATYAMANALGAGSAFTITYTLSNGATWGTALTGASCAYTPSAGGALSVAMVSGGGVADSTAQFRIDVTAATAATDTFILTYNIDDADPLATAAATIDLSVALADLLAPVDTAGTLTVFTGLDAAASTIAASAVSTDLYIDVTENSAKFTGTLATDLLSTTHVKLGNMNLVDSGALEDDAATAWVSGAGDALNTTTITVTGNFAASLAVDTDANALTFDGLYLDLNGSNTYNAGEEATTLTATTATWVIANQGPIGATNINMVVDGTTVLVPGAASVTATIDWANTTYADSTYTGTLRNLQKNGDTATANLALTPGGVYSNYVRISNTSSIDGEVFIKLYQDDGTVSSTFQLSDIDSNFSDTLVGQASTAQMTIQSLYDASDLAAGYTGKLRIEAEGEFSSIDMQTYTVSLDNNSFATF